MNGKQLKNSILQWAIQGKLVPQDPNDEPASVLLERIRAEKKRLIKEGKIKKDKNESIIFRGEDNSHYEKFPDGRVVCINNEIPFEIPQGWEWTRLGAVFELKSGQDFPPEKYSSNPEGTLYLTGASNLDGEKILENRWTKTPSVIAPFGSLLLVCKGSGVGKMCLMNLPEAHIARQLQAIIPISQDIDIRIIQIALECRLQEITQKANGVIPGIAREAVLGFLLPIPPRNEQERILDKVLMLSPLVDRYGEKQQTLEILNCNLRERLRRSILQEAIQGKLVPQDPNDEPAPILLERIRVEKQKLLKEGKLQKRDIFNSTIYKGEDNKYYEKIDGKVLDINDEIPFDIPESWMWVRVASIANLYTGNSISETEKRARYTSVAGKEYIGTKDVGFDHRINYTNGVAIPAKYLSDFRIASSGSVLMCIEGGSAGRKIAILEKDVCFGNKLCCFAPYVEIAQYIYYYLQSPSFFEVFQQNKTGIIGGVSVNTLKDMLIALPPKNEQIRIIAKIRSLKL